MPKIAWRSKPKEKPPIRTDYLGDLIKTSMKQRNMTYETLAPKIGLTKSSASQKKFRGVGKFQVDELFDWCKALDVDEAALLRAVENAYREAR